LWYEAGVKYINDLISKDGKFISLNVFQRTFGIKTNFLQYLGLLNAIPMSWKKTLKATNNEEVTVVKVLSKVYRIFQARNVESK